MTTPAPLRFGPREGLRYGLLGLPLAFVALPLYVLLPHHYAVQYGVPLGVLGGTLLAARLADAVIDPWLGRAVDRLFARSVGAVLRLALACCVLLALGLVLLFHSQWLVDVREQGPLLWTATACLLASYAAYSLLSIAHQSWGARLGGDETMRARIVGWREGFGLVGVVLASVLPTLVGLSASLVVFALSLGLAWLAWRLAPRPAVMTAHDADARPAARGLMQAWSNKDFRRLLAVFVLNGMASAIPATLVLFFVQDRLQASAAMQPAFLGGYFVCAALSIPLWLRLVRRLGLARTWLAGMLLAIAVFGAAALLATGDGLAFLWVCALSGAALGTDLVLPGALLAGLIGQRREQATAGSYFGWWNFATKLNLALAAGLALPLLGLAGYLPGTRDEDALWALTAAYCVLPCILKALAALSLWVFFIRPAATPPLKVSTWPSDPS